MNARPGLRRILLDTLSWVGGWMIIFKQAGILFVPPSQVNETLIWMGAALVGVPGLTQLGAVLLGRTPTDGPGQRPASPDSPPSSSGAPSREAEV